MKEIKNIKLLKVFQVNENKYKDYLVYVFENGDNYELYLTHKQYGIMSYIIGVPKEQQSLEELLTLDFSDDISYYRIRYEF